MTGPSLKMIEMMELSTVFLWNTRDELVRPRFRDQTLSICQFK